MYARFSLKNFLGIFGLVKNGTGGNMKIKVISDIHGHYKEMIKSLEEVNYSENEDKLIVLGDLFDRGEESLEVYQYLKRLKEEDKAVILHGNHEDFIIDFLKGKDCSFNFRHNGFDKTIDSFLGQTNAWFMFNLYCSDSKDLAISIYGDRVKSIIEDYEAVPIEIKFDVFQDYVREDINKNYPELLDWLESLQYYYETDNYIFTHASIDGSCEDWHNPTYSKYEDWSPWKWLTWDNGSFYEQDINNTDKTIVVGHFYTDYIRKRYDLPFDSNLSNDILYGEQKIFIDSCVPITRRLNVLQIEDSIVGGS